MVSGEVLLSVWENMQQQPPQERPQRGVMGREEWRESLFGTANSKSSLCPAERKLDVPGEGVAGLGGVGRFDKQEPNGR